MDTTRLTRRVRQLDAWSRRAPVIGLVRAVLDKSGRDRGGDLAAVIAFYGFFSIFPLLLALGTIVGFLFADHPDLQARAIEAVTDQFPDSPELQEAVASVPGSGWALAIGVVGSIWGGLGVVNATRTAFDEVWEIPRDEQAGLVRARLVGLAAILAVGGVLFASVVLGSVAPGRSGQVVAGLLALGAFAAVFVVLTPPGIGWRQLGPGVVIATVAWIGLQALGSTLIRRQLGQVSVGAGVFAVSLVLLAWMALQARIVVLAAELDQVLVSRAQADESRPEPSAPPTTRGSRLGRST